MAVSHAAAVKPALDRPAVQTALAARSVLVGAALAGRRVVAVGERGIVVLSDDAGAHWRQVPVPVSVGLTAVRFVDERHGWIVGHGGVVLASADGGETWTKQFDGRQAAQVLRALAASASDPKAQTDAERLAADGADMPLLDLHFFDTQHGLVVGAYNLAFSTADGGKTWQPLSQRLDNPRGLHLYAVRARGDEVLIVGEQGLVLRSSDRALSFVRLTLPYAGSFFTAELPGPRELVVAGLRGNVWRSADGGASWQPLKNSAAATITASTLDADGRLWLTNQAGRVLMRSDDTLVPLPAKWPPLTGLLPLPAAADGRAALALTLTGALPLQLGTPK